MSFFDNNPQTLHIVRLFAAGLLAIVLALSIIYAVLSWRAQQSAQDGSSLTEQEKMAILAGLSSTSTPSEKEKRAVLNGISGSESELSAEQKLQILQGL